MEVSRIYSIEPLAYHFVQIQLFITYGFYGLVVAVRSNEIEEYFLILKTITVVFWPLASQVRSSSVLVD